MEAGLQAASRLAQDRCLRFLSVRVTLLQLSSYEQGQGNEASLQLPRSRLGAQHGPARGTSSLCGR